MTRIVGQLPPLELNPKTAGPLLRLLLAQSGNEEPYSPNETNWEVFKLFCHLPSATASDVVSFQATWTPEEAAEAPDPALFYCTWSRELHEADDLFPETRAVQMQWALDADPDEMQDFEAWSDDFPDLESFFAAVEASSQFKALAASDSSIGELYTVDLEMMK